MQDDVLEVMVTEYKVLRNELYKIYDNQIRTLAVVVSALGIVYGIIFTDYYNLSKLFLIIPLIIFPFGLRFQYASRGAVILSNYLEHLEAQIKRKKHHLEWQGWIGFQNYYMVNEHSKTIDRIYDALPKFLIFILLPMGIATYYSFMSNTYILLGLIYFIFIVISYPLFKYIEKIAERETLEKCPNTECNARVERKFDYCPKCGKELRR